MSALPDVLIPPADAAMALAASYRRMLMSRMRVARSAPIISTVRSKVMFSSCSPTAALAAGVKMGSGKRLAFCKPSGSGTPQTERLSWYSFQPLPAR